MAVMKLSELRRKFETSAKLIHFPVDKTQEGEYTFPATFNMWVGYWLAARDSGLISGADAESEYADYQ